MPVKKSYITAMVLLAAILAAGLPLSLRGELLVSYGASQASGQWSQVSDEEGTHWIYTDPRGERVCSQKMTIEGRTYFFDDQGYMIDGWVSKDGERIDDSDGRGYLEGMYYCGGPDEGWSVTGWKYIHIFREEGGAGRCWFYFKESGKKAVDTSITEEDSQGRYRYTFDENGILKSSKKTGSSGVSNEEGMPSGQWLQKVPGRSQDIYAYENNIKRWYYGLNDGTIVKNGIKTIQGKKYLFDSAGIMRTGLIAVDSKKKYAVTLIHSQEDKDCDLSELKEYTGEYDLMYFDETTGERRTGKVGIKTMGEEKTFVFDSSGRAVHGEYQGYLYIAGLLQKADKDLKYEVISVDDREYLVNTSGKVQKKGRYKDKDEVVWIVEKENGVYVITME